MNLPSTSLAITTLTLTIIGFLGHSTNSAILPSYDNPTKPTLNSIELMFEEELPAIGYRVADVSTGYTTSVVRTIEGGASECSALPSEYRVDCLSQTFRKAAGRMNGEYNRARTPTAQASTKLRRLVSQNLDKEAKPIKRKGKTFRAVKKSSVSQVNSQAKKIIAETATKIIRSTTSKKRQIHYQRISQAVDSTKLILRS